MALTSEEIQKVNHLFSQIDELTKENNELKQADNSNHDAILSRLDSLEELIKEVSCKCDEVKNSKCSVK